MSCSSAPYNSSRASAHRLVPLLLLAVALAVPVTADREDAERFRELKSRCEKAGALRSDRIEALSAMAELDHEPAVDYLIATLVREKDEKVVDAILAALIAHPTRAAVEGILGPALATLEPHQCEQVAAGLTDITDPKTIDWIVSKGWKAIPKFPAAAQAAYLEVAGRIRDPRVAKLAEKLLKKPCAVAGLVAAVRVLEEHKAYSATKKLAGMIKKAEPEVQLAILEALLTLGPADAVKSLEAALASDDWRVRVTAVDIIASQRNPGHFPMVTPLLNDPVTAVAVAVVEFLRLTGGPDAVEALIGALGDVEGRVQDDIAEALVRLTGKDHGTVAANWDSWWTANRDSAEIRGISREEYERIKEEQESSSTAVYFGLRVISNKVTFVVDCSASMGDVYEVTEKIKKKKKKGKTAVPEEEAAKTRKVRKQKIEVAREELTRVLEQLRLGTFFNIFQFNSLHERWKPELVEKDRKTLAAAKKYVKELAAGGMTNVYDALMDALSDPEVDTIYLLSDGMPTAGTITATEEILTRVVEANRLAKVKINTIGFHLDAGSKRFLKRLSEQNFGRFVSR